MESWECRGICRKCIQLSVPLPVEEDSVNLSCCIYKYRTIYLKLDRHSAITFALPLPNPCSPNPYLEVVLRVDHTQIFRDKSREWRTLYDLWHLGCMCNYPIFFYTRMKEWICIQLPRFHSLGKKWWLSVIIPTTATISLHTSSFLPSVSISRKMLTGSTSGSDSEWQIVLHFLISDKLIHVASSPTQLPTHR